MHSLKGQSCYMNFNSDLSGDVLFSVKAERIETLPTGMTVVKIDGGDLMKLIAEHVRMERISRLEQATTEQLLGIGDAVPV